ncbi:hypothetical protein ACFL0N_03065 [Pseudomonadota bacterium]
MLRMDWHQLILYASSRSGLSTFSHPETPSKMSSTQGHESCDIICHCEIDVRHQCDDFITGVELQKCLEKVGLVPASLSLNEPGFWIFERVADIMNMNQDTIGDIWHYFAEKEIHIASTFAHVRRIDKQNVAAGEAFPRP